jgi:plastocyanin
MRRGEWAIRALAHSLAGLALLAGLPAKVQAQAVQDCQPGQYVDLTAPGAVRQLTWDRGAGFVPEHCMQIQIGQTVVWVGDLGTHPLLPAPDPRDTSNPIYFFDRIGDNASVTFHTLGTFGYQCNAHPGDMYGTIKVVQAAPAVPTLSPWVVVALTALLLGTGVFTVTRRSRGAMARS